MRNLEFQIFFSSFSPPSPLSGCISASIHQRCASPLPLFSPSSFAVRQNYSSFIIYFFLQQERKKELEGKTAHLNKSFEKKFVASDKIGPFFAPSDGDEKEEENHCHHSFTNGTKVPALEIRKRGWGVESD